MFSWNWSYFFRAGIYSHTDNLISDSACVILEYTECVLNVYAYLKLCTPRDVEVLHKDTDVGDVGGNVITLCLNGAMNMPEQDPTLVSLGQFYHNGDIVYGCPNHLEPQSNHWYQYIFSLSMILSSQYILVDSSYTLIWIGLPRRILMNVHMWTWTILWRGNLIKIILSIRRS